MNEPNLKDTAYILHLQNIACIPIENSVSKAPPWVDENKTRRLAWGYLDSNNYWGEIEKIFKFPHSAIGVLGGYVSGGLEILDVDLKHARDPEQLWLDLMTNIGEALPEFAAECTVVKTVSGGYHIYYSCKKIGGSKKLTHETNPNYDPTAEPKTPKYHAVIETKGNGGYALTVPSEGYELVQGSIDRFAYQLTPEERDTLHEICRMLDEKAHDVPQDIPRPKPEPRQYNTSGRYQDWLTDPWTDYNKSISESEVISLIERAGFDRPKRKGDEIEFHRIGSDNPHGAGWNTKKKVFYSFTPNSLLTQDKGYNAAQILTELYFKGDKKECYKWLINNGYGVKFDPGLKTSHLQTPGAGVNYNPAHPTEIPSNGNTSQMYPVLDEFTIDRGGNRLLKPPIKQPLSDEDLAKILADHEIRVTDKIDPPKPAWVQLTGGEDVLMGTLGNFSLLIGKAKAGKSFLTAIVIAAALSNPNDELMDLFRGCLPDDKRTVLYFDTEQGSYHVQLAVKRICKMIGVSEPDNLKVYGLRSLDHAERLAAIDYKINSTDGVGFVAIDGIRDMVTSINDEEQATMMATKLLRWTEERQIHIATVLHQNKGDSNARGHLGAELVNKAETVLSVTKSPQDKSISIVESVHCRNKDPEPFAFEIIDNLPFIVENYELRTETKKDQFDLMDLPPAEIFSMLNIVFSRGGSFTHGNLKSEIKVAFKEKFGKTIGNNRITDLIAFCKSKRWLIQEKDRAPYQQGKFDSGSDLPF